MNEFGWLAKDNVGTVWEDKHFPESPGGPTHWASFVNLLEAEDRWLDLFSLRHKKQWYAMPPSARQYAFHYDIEVELGAHGNVSKTYAVGIAVNNLTANVRRVDEEGHTEVIPVYASTLTLMKPSPLRKAC